MTEIERLRKYKEDNNLTYEKLAREMDLNYRNIFRWLKEDEKPSHTSMKVIRTFLEKVNVP